MTISMIEIAKALNAANQGTAAMKIIKIKKRNGTYRTVFVPSYKQRNAMRRDYLPRLNSAQVAICDLNVVHGFMPGKSPVTAAIPHVGYQYTLSLDVAGFFDSVEYEMLPKDVQCACGGNRKLFPSCITTRRARQGLPTSPAIANIAAAKMDEWFKAWCREHDAVYTRYADDLSISCNDLDALKNLRLLCHDTTTHKIATHIPFVFNQSKTRIQWGGPDGDWTREVVGVGVGKHAIRPLRDARRKLRAARHQGNSSQAEGLAEWCRLRPPHPVDYDKIAELHLAKVALGL